LWGVLRSTPPQQYFEESDKVLHLLAFGSVAFVGRLALLHMRDVIYWPLIMSGAISLELVQGWLWTSRHFSLFDAAANVVGVQLAAVAYLVVKRIVGFESGKGYSDSRSLRLSRPLRDRSYRNIQCWNHRAAVVTDIPKAKVGAPLKRAINRPIALK